MGRMREGMNLEKEDPPPPFPSASVPFRTSKNEGLLSLLTTVIDCIYNN